MAEAAPESTSEEPRHRLAGELRRARRLAGISGRGLAKKIKISQSKVSRIESGAAIPSLPEVHAWADAVQASTETRQLLMVMTEAAHTATSRWQTELHGRSHLQGDVEKTERDTRKILTFQPSVVPGLLQTAEYARRIFEMFQERHYSPDQLAAAVAARLERQLLLHNQDKIFEFLITEAALRWRPSTHTLLAAQIDRISSLSTLNNITVGVLPLTSQATVPHSHAFTIYEPSSEEDNVFTNVDMIHGSVQLFDESDVHAYQRRWAALHESALFGDDARTFMNELVTEIRVSSA